MIKEKSVVLLLGAGASVGAKHPEDKKIAQGKELSKLIAEQFLDDSYYDNPLTYNADMVIDDPGLFPLQNFLHDYFVNFAPAEHHLLIANIPWRSIFTLNYDLIIEQAYAKCVSPIQELAIFKSDNDRFEEKITSKKHLPLYKLHGCITSSNDYDIPFILSTEQYITHKKNRITLFKSFREQAMTSPIVYIGTSLQDNDIRSVMLELDADAYGQQYRSYIITPSPKKKEISFWAARKITVLEGTFKDFLESIIACIDRNHLLLSLYNNSNDLHELYRYFINNHQNKSSLIDDFLDNAVIHINNRMSSKKANAKRFYKGEGQGFAPIIEGLDLKRGLSDTVLTNNIFDDNNDQQQKFIIIMGHAGAGKTILLRRIAYDAGIQFDKLSFWVENSQQIDNEAISEIYSRAKQRIFLFIDDASKNYKEIKRILRYSFTQSIPVTVISTDRINIWNDTSKDLGDYVTDEYTLYYLNKKEVDSLVDLLRTHDSLGYLTGKPREEQIEALTNIHGRQLLVALHEATLGKTFPEIVFDEYKTIYPEAAQQLYKTICTLHRLGIKVRAGLIARLHNITFEKFEEHFFKPLEGIVTSRFDETLQDYTYETRHRCVAELAFEKIFSGYEERYMEFMRILQNINIEYRPDYEALVGIINAHNLIDLVGDPNLIRILYSTIIKIYPSNPFLYQQQAIFEMNHNGGSLTNAKDNLDKAIQLAPQNTQIKHTIANFERKLGQAAQSPLERATHRRRAKEIAQSLFNAPQRKDTYSYSTYLNTSLDDLKDDIKQEGNQDTLSQKIDAIQRTLQMALQIFPDDSIILDIEHEFFKLIGESEKSIESLKKSFTSNKANTYIAISLTNHYVGLGNRESALSTVTEALQHNPYNKDLHFLCAKILMSPYYLVDETIKHHLRHAFTHGDNRYEAQFWYARLLYIQQNEGEATTLFNTLKQANIEPKLKQKPRGIISDHCTHKRFHGTIASISHSHLFIAPDSGKTWIFAYAKNSNLDDFSAYRYRQRIQYSLAFNFKGTTAIDLLPE